jgi:1,4-dihydroxy-2-naphthoate octaprenyltransferase
MQTKISFSNIIRALRMPFAAVSILPFLFGSLIPGIHLNLFYLLLGLFVVTCTHLSANLINDYFDSKSGADWQDRRFFGFFGGSKLIQEAVLPEGFYLALAIFLGALAFLCALSLAILMKSFFLILMFFLIIILSWQYTALPLRLSYRYLGELFIFILFGPLTVMGGYYIQTGIFPDQKSFMLSLPFGFFTAAILVSNEIPDSHDDRICGKFTLVNLIGQKRAYILYSTLVALGFLATISGVFLRYISPVALIVLLFIPIAIKSAAILRRCYSDKSKLVQSSALTIKLQFLTGLALILGALI